MYTLKRLFPEKIQTKAKEEKAKARERLDGEDAHHQPPVLVQVLKFLNLCAHYHVVLKTSDDVRNWI